LETTRAPAVSPHTASRCVLVMCSSYVDQALATTIVPGDFAQAFCSR